MLTKNCTFHSHVGDRELPISHFYSDKRRKDGYMLHCKACDAIKRAVYRNRHKDDPAYKTNRNQRNTESRKRQGKIGQLYNAAMQRARKSGLDFTITKEDIIIPEFCPVLGIPIIAGSGRKWGESSTEPNKLVGALDTSPSIDRIDNSKGYIPGNIMVISWRANYLKNNASFDELILLGEHARRMKTQLEKRDENREDISSQEV